MKASQIPSPTNLFTARDQPLISESVRIHKPPQIDLFPTSSMNANEGSRGPGYMELIDYLAFSDEKQLAPLVGMSVRI